MKSEESKWVLGITGGVGSGKSEVLAFLEEEYGAEVIRTDETARDLMKPGTDCCRRIVAAFGEEIRLPDGTIDRAALSALVFSDEEKRRVLNGLTHPAVKTEVKRIIRESGSTFLVVEAALLLEEHYEEICDEIWYVYARPEERFERLLKSRGYSEKKTRSVMNSQLPDSVFRARCQVTVDNSGAFSDTACQLEEALAGRGIFPKAKRGTENS